MLSGNDRQKSTENGQKPMTSPLQLPGLVSQLSPSEQLPFPDYTPPPLNTAIHAPVQTSPGVTRQLYGPGSNPGQTHALDFTGSLHTTGNLPNLQTGAVPILNPTTTSLRQPVVIRGTGKKSSGTIRPPQGRRWVISVAATTLVLVITIVTLMIVQPAGRDGRGGFNPFQSVTNWLQNGDGNTGSISQVAATATAYTRQDGCETCSSYSPPLGNASGDSFTFGQCTYWADYRYHQLSTYWVPWSGNAGDWAYNATLFAKQGWVVSSTPKVPSIIVLAPWVQGASGYGHVAVVEKINADGSVYTSNYNWWAAGGGWDILSYWTFHTGSGVSFVWHV